MIFRRLTNTNTQVNGYTLIELLIVISVTVVLLLVGGFLFGGVLKNSACSTQLNEVNQNGKYVIDMIERKVRQATKIWVYDGSNYVTPSLSLPALSPWTCSGSITSFKCQCIETTGCKFAITNPEANYTGFMFQQEVLSPLAPGFISMADGDVLNSLIYNKVITNTDPVKGVTLDEAPGAVDALDYSPGITIDYSVGRPIVVGINFVLSSGIESDQQCGARSPFRTQVSLRSY